MRIHRHLLAIPLLVACSQQQAEPDPIQLSNADSAEDRAASIMSLSDHAPKQNLYVNCDSPDGCAGYVSLQVGVPDGTDACTFFFQDERCNTPNMPATSLTIGTLTVRSTTEGTRQLPLIVSTQTGEFTRTSLAASFSGRQGEWVKFEFTKSYLGDLEITAIARWEDGPLPDSQQLETYLRTVPGLRFHETNTQYPGVRAYALEYEQPLDHNDPNGRKFTQYATLHHRSQEKPMVLFTSGYDLYEDYESEIAESHEWNQLTTEQRFFNESRPLDMTPQDWQYVTIQQAAADHHRFVEMLKPFYQGRWVSTGHSKGGMTSVYHRRFYPNDVDATVAYVAPISFSLQDERYLALQDSAVGREECHARMRNYQNAILDRDRQVARAFLTAWATPGDPALTAEDISQIIQGWIEPLVKSREWTFWQYEGLQRCNTIPAGDDLTNVDLLMRSLLGNNLPGAADAPVGGPLEGVAPASRTNNRYGWFYGWLRQLGGPANATAHLIHPIQGRPPSPPPGVDSVEYDSTAMPDVQNWVMNEGDNILFLYGQFDPWTGGAFDVPANSNDVYRVDVAQGTHNAVFRDLNETDRARVEASLVEWMSGNSGMAPVTPASPSWEPAFAPHPPRLEMSLPVR